MADKDAKPADKPEPQPLPVDVISSIPLSVQIAPESLASLGAPPAGTAEPVTVATATASPLGAGATAGTTTTTVTSTVPPPVMVTKDEGLVLAPTTTAAADKVTEGQRRINLLWESSQSIISVAITFAVIYCQIQSIQSETLNNAFFFVVATYLQRTNHVRKGGIPPVTNGSYQGR